MPSTDSRGPNTFGYAIALAAGLGVALLALGGTDYSVHALALFVAALFVLSVAMRRTRGNDGPPQDAEDDRSDEEKQREKEMLAEAGGYGGEGGGM